MWLLFHNGYWSKRKNGWYKQKNTPYDENYYGDFVTKNKTEIHFGE